MALPHNPTASPTQANTVPHALKPSEAAELVGATVEALRLRVKRGTLASIPVVGSRGRKVAGVLANDLFEAYPDAHPTAKHEPNPVPHASPTVPNSEPSELEAELAKERSLRQAQAETNSRALAVIQDRQLAPIFERLELRIDQAREEAASARKDSRMFAVLALVLVGTVGAFSIYRIQTASGSTVLAHERTIEAMGEVQTAQAQALSQATQRAAVETELATVKQEAKTAQDAAEKAENQLRAIALVQRVRRVVSDSIQAFR